MPQHHVRVWSPKKEDDNSPHLHVTLCCVHIASHDPILPRTFVVKEYGSGAYSGGSPLYVGELTLLTASSASGVDGRLCFISPALLRFVGGERIDRRS